MEIIKMSDKDFFNKVMDEAMAIGIFTSVNDLILTQENVKRAESLMGVYKTGYLCKVSQVDPVLMSHFTGGVFPEYKNYIAVFKFKQGVSKLDFVEELK